MRHLFVGGTFDSTEPSDQGAPGGQGGKPAAGPAATWGEAVEVHRWNDASCAVSQCFSCDIHSTLFFNSLVKCYTC